MTRLYRIFFYFLSMCAFGSLALTTGCASGGYKLTRQYARFVNHQPLILRIILYLLTAIVFAATLLIDSVYFNTIDFWKGRVSSGTYEFEKDGQRFIARHENLPLARKRSTLEVFGVHQELLQTLVIQETEERDIELWIDGRLRTRVKNINELPVAHFFNERGELTGVQSIDSSLLTAVAAP